MSDPLQSPSPNQMEESICLDDESLLSPEAEELPVTSPLAVSPLVQLDRPEPPLPELDEDEEQPEKMDPSEDESGLGLSATTVTIDLGSQASLDRVGDSQVTMATDLGADVKEETVQDKGKVMFEVGAEGEAEVKTKADPGEKSISSYFSSGASTSDDPFASVVQTQQEVVSLPPASTVTALPEYEVAASARDAGEEEDTRDQETIITAEIGGDAIVEVKKHVEEEDEDILKIRTESMSSTGRTQEAVPVGFEESKGSGKLKFAGSTENVRQLFAEDTGVADDSGKSSFFESFTAGEGAELEGVTQQPPQPLKVDTSISISGNVVVPATPPIPGPASPVPSPLHTAAVTVPGGSRSRTTSQSSTGVSPMHSSHSFSEDARPPPPLETQLSDKSDGQRSTPAASFSEGEDLFSASLNMSDADRRRDAWIPTEQTRATLVTMVTSAPGTYFPGPEQMTMPGIVIDDPQGDPVKDLMVRFMGDAEASKRFTMTSDNVSQDENGLRQLIGGECFRSAIDLTGKLLLTQGQGPGKVNVPSKHNQFSLQVWFTRIALLIKLRLYSQAESEIQAFGSLDKPDLYYEFYPDMFQGRRGSMVPFSFRIIHAELPQYLGKTQESLDRLYYIYAIVQKILVNLESGLAEDGSMLQLNEESRKASRELWEYREVRLLYSIGNCLLHSKDFGTAVSVFEKLSLKDPEHRSGLLCGVGRLYLQMGDISSAQNYFNKVEECNKDRLNDKSVKVAHLMNKGFLALGKNQFSEAQQLFKDAVTNDPGNAVAVNNMAVCSLYMGKLKEALSTLENLVHSDPTEYLQEGILFNLCTLYELESSRAINKKQALLDLVSKHKGNGFNVACLKMT